MFKVSVLVVSTFTLSKDAGLVEDIVPISIVGLVIVPSCATANPEIVISPQAKVGVADCIAVCGTRYRYYHHCRKRSGTKIETVSVCVVSTLTILKEDGLIALTVPMSVDGVVTVPSCATAKPLNVIP